MEALNSITELKQLAEEYRKIGYTIGLCHGCFDIIHPGHVYHLQQAKALVDRLFVSITADCYVNKGPDRPIFPGARRADVVGSIRYCDHVIVNDAATAESMIEALRPDLFFKGADYSNGADPRVQAEKSLVETNGGVVIITDDKVFDSTSRIAKIVTSNNK